MMHVPPILLSGKRQAGRLYTLVHDRVFAFRKSTVFELSCNETENTDTSCPATFRFGDAAELRALDEERHDYSPAARRFGFQRLAQGDSFVIGESGGAVVFYAWLMWCQFDLEEGDCIPLRRDMAYSYRVFTAPAARGLGICAAYYRFLRPLLAREGFTRIACRIVNGNEASVRAHRRAGFTARGEFCRLFAAGSVWYRADAVLCPWLREAGVPGRFADGAWLHRQNLPRPEGTVPPRRHLA